MTKLPQWFLDQPVIPEGAEFFYNAFWDLSTERQIGMGLGPIPTSRIDERAREAGLDYDTALMFRQVIRAMDTAYLKEAQKLSNTKKPNG